MVMLGSSGVAGLSSSSMIFRAASTATVHDHIPGILHVSCFRLIARNRSSLQNATLVTGTFCLYRIVEQSATWSDMSHESHLSTAEFSGNASTDPFPAGDSKLSASLEAARREEDAQREKTVTEWICPDGRRTWSVVRRKVTMAEGSQFKEGEYHLVIIWLSHVRQIV
jgi:hypothetical protein